MGKNSEKMKNINLNANICYFSKLYKICRPYQPLSAFGDNYFKFSQASRQFAVLCSFHSLFIDFNKNEEKHQLVLYVDIVKHALPSETYVISCIKKLYSGAFTGRQYV